MRHRHALVALAAVTGSLLHTGSAAALSAQCTDIPASSNAETNHAAIQGCLTAEGGATLVANAVYPVFEGLVLGDGDTLTAPVASRATIRFAPTANSDPAAYRALVQFTGDGAHVQGVNVDADSKLPTATDIVRVANLSSQPSGNVMEDGSITGGSLSGITTVGNHDLDPGPTALSFRCTDCSGNVVRRVEMTDNYRVVGFHGVAKTKETGNRVELSSIHHNQCDAVSFRGYGVLYDNDISENGGRCGTLHGGGVYSTQNEYGAHIEKNDVWNICGHGIDLIDSKYLTVHDNDVWQPGQISLDPSHGFCGSATAMSVRNVRLSTISANVLKNLDAPWNMRDNDPGLSVVFADKGATPYSDLPNGERTLMAFALVWDGDQTWTTRSNVIKNNTFLATCSSVTNCLGLSAFVGRGTGVYADQAVNDASRNMFWGNKVYGSERRTERLGRNWWGKGFTCDERADWALDGCNDDDYQWNPPTGSIYRNHPDKGTYSSLPLA